MRMPDPDQDTIRRRQAIAADLRAIVGDNGVIADDDELKAYDCDGMSVYRQLPMLVALPRSTAE
ncbi:MAG: FAD-binding oxidoreductase, partial [Alphaproteobacteria bacterium]|nr:FAD-binding oxidoreductase [Alphaproteobacteria bacterium]